MAAFIGQVTGGRLNLRSSCSTSGDPLIQILNNTIINVSTVSGQNEWFQTSYAGCTGYVMSRYVAITNDGGTCTVTTSSGSLNVRVKPQIGATLLYTAA